MAHENAQTRLGIYPAGEDLKEKRYYSVQLVESPEGKPQITLGNGSVAGILGNTPVRGQAAQVVLSGIVPARLSDSLEGTVEVGDRLSPEEDGTLIKGEGPYLAANTGSAGAFIEVLIGPFSKGPASASLDEETVILIAEKADATYTYSGDDISSINYVDASGITNNSKVYSYDGEDVETVTHTFEYQTETWTVTTAYTYTAGKLTGKTRTIGKV